MRAQDGQARSFSFGLSMSLSVGLSIGVATALLARPASAEVKLSPYADGGMMLDPGQSFFVFTVTGDGRMLDATPSAGVGLTKWLALDGSLGTLSTDPRARYHGGQAGLWFALVDTPPFELDFTAHATVFAEPGRLGPQVEPGVYAIVRAAHRFRLDVSAFAPITFGHLPSSSSPLREPVPGHEPPLEPPVEPPFPAPLPDPVEPPGAYRPTTLPSLRVPIAFSVQLSERLHATLSSGLSIADLRAPIATTTFPLGFTMGGKTALLGGAYAVLLPSIASPDFFDPHRPAGRRPSIVGSLTLAVVLP